MAADSTGGHKRGHPWKLWSTAGGSDHPPCVVWLPWSDAGHEGHCLDRDVVSLNLVVQNDYSLWWMPHVLLQGPGTNDDVLIEIFASRSNAQISALNEAYLQGELWKKRICELFICHLNSLSCLFLPQRRRRSWPLTWRRNSPETFPKLCSSSLRSVRDWCSHLPCERNPEQKTGYSPQECCKIN